VDFGLCLLGGRAQVRERSFLYFFDILSFSPWYGRLDLDISTGTRPARGDRAGARGPRPHRGTARAGALREQSTIANLDAASETRDRARKREIAERDCHTGPSYAERLCDRGMSERERLAFGALVESEQPPAEPLLECVKQRAGADPHGLIEETPLEATNRSSKHAVRL
jgi:hypothetical protein